MLCLAAAVSGCAAGRSAFNKAEKLEREGNLDDAVVKYAEAAAANPDVGEYRLRFLKASEKAAREHFAKGDRFFENKKYDDALREYQTAFTLDPSFIRAKQQGELAEKLRNAQFFFSEGVSLEKDRKIREAIRAYQKALEFDPESREAKDAVERLQKSRRTKLDGTELNLKSNKPITLKFKDAKIKEVFNILSQLSGINFIFDEGLKDQNVSVFLENATFQQALDIITGINKLGKKVLNESTIIVYPKNPEKSKQYEELYVQTFFLDKLDAKKAVNLIRTMLQVKKIYVNEEMNAIVIRDTPEVIEVAQKILDANDVPDAELVLEVEVLEVSNENKENFGLGLSRYSISAAAAASGSNSFLSDTLPTTIQTTTDGTGTGTTTTTSTTPSNLLQFFSYRGYGGFLTVPNATFNFAKSLGKGETLANPRLRVKNREKAKFNVGQRVPITTTSTPTTGGFSVNVQYVDVGVKLNAEPTVQLNNEVTMKVSLEVSSIIGRQNVGSDGGTTVVTIGTRNLDTVLSLKDGETSIIGGLVDDSKQMSKQKVYLLGDIPLIGPLLTNHSTEGRKSELILAITPHIVRGITVPELDVAAFWSGREDEPAVGKSYSSFQEVEPAADQAAPAPQAPAAAPRPALPAAPAVAPVPVPVPSPVPAPSAGIAQPALPQAAPAPEPGSPSDAGKMPPPASDTGAVPGAAPPAPAAASPSAPPPPAPRAALSVTAPKSIKKNDQFKVDVQVSNAASISKAAFTFVYDPIFVEFVSAAEGPFMKQDGKPTTFQNTVDKGTGQVSVTINRAPDAGSISGGGSLMSALFKARNQGPANFGFLGVTLSDVGGKAQETIPYNTVVEVK